jgi:hypothetical protein
VRGSRFSARFARQRLSCARFDATLIEESKGAGYGKPAGTGEERRRNEPRSMYFLISVSRFAVVHSGSSSEMEKK